MSLKRSIHTMAIRMMRCPGSSGCHVCHATAKALRKVRCESETSKKVESA